jgi:hypothetical protein
MSDNNDKLVECMMEESLELEEIAYFDKIYYIFDRHRTSFLCWIKAFNEGIIGNDNLLITIDKHCDFFIEDPNREHIQLAKSKDIKKIRENIKENNKQDFILMAMEAGIVRDIVIISPIINKSEFPKGLPSEYKDDKGNIHKATYFSSIEEFEQKFPNKKNYPVILDIDLDYFQTHVKNILEPIEKWKNTKRLTKTDRKSFFKPETKLNDIYHNSKIVTLAKEMSYSHGKGKVWAEEFLELFCLLENFYRGDQNPFVVEEDEDEMSDF